MQELWGAKCNSAEAQQGSSTLQQSLLCIAALSCPSRRVQLSVVKSIGVIDAPADHVCHLVLDYGPSRTRWAAHGVKRETCPCTALHCKGCTFEANLGALQNQVGLHTRSETMSPAQRGVHIRSKRGALQYPVGCSLGVSLWRAQQVVHIQGKTRGPLEPRGLHSQTATVSLGVRLWQGQAFMYPSTHPHLRPLVSAWTCPLVQSPPL